MFERWYYQKCFSKCYKKSTILYYLEKWNNSADVCSCFDAGGSQISSKCFTLHLVINKMSTDCETLMKNIKTP